jgi:hypothetical protein
MTIYYFEDGEYVSLSGYFLGAILAEITQWQLSSAKDTRAHNKKSWRWNWIGEFCALVLFLVVLFFVLQTPERLERATYPRSIYQFTKQYLIPSGRKIPFLPLFVVLCPFY